MPSNNIKDYITSKDFYKTIELEKIPYSIRNELMDIIKIFEMVDLLGGINYVDYYVQQNKYIMPYRLEKKLDGKTITIKDLNHYQKIYWRYM